MAQSPQHLLNQKLFFLLLLEITYTALLKGKNFLAIRTGYRYLVLPFFVEKRPNDPMAYKTRYGIMWRGVCFAFIRMPDIFPSNRSHRKVLNCPHDRCV